MVTTLGDLRRENPARTGSASAGTPHIPPFARAGDVGVHLPHEIIGILVAQALDWDAQRIIEAFTVALKQVTGQGLGGMFKGSGDQTNPGAESTGAAGGKVPGLDDRQLAQDTMRIESHAPANAYDRLDNRVAVSDQLVQASDAGSEQSIAEVRQQFITLGELVLEAIEEVNRGGGEAVG